MYKDLVAYQLALPITSLTWQFLNLYIPKTSRTYDQMEQALRSGKQNIVEGSLEKSLKSNIKLTGVARASFEELLEDLKDFLLSHNLPIWNKTDPRVLRVRAVRVNPSNSTNLSNLTNWTNLINLPSSPESHANLLITLISLETYLLDQLLRKLEKNFVEEGGYSENLTLKRKEYKAKDPRYMTPWQIRQAQNDRADAWLKMVNDGLKAGKSSQEALKEANEAFPLPTQP